MSNEGHRRTKDGERRIEHRSEEQRKEELNEQNGCIPNDGTKRHDSNTNEGARWLSSVTVGEGLDEHVCDGEEDGHDDGEYDFREQDSAPAGTRNVARELLGGVTQSFPLVAGDHRP